MYTESYLVFFQNYLGDDKFYPTPLVHDSKVELANDYMNYLTNSVIP